jgi:ABC-type transport system involved in cytochrome bd biosynthesis fused ATPase/permease subunit
MKYVDIDVEKARITPEQREAMDEYTSSVIMKGLFGEEEAKQMLKQVRKAKTIFFSTHQERHRQHTDPYILAKLEEGRNRRSLWLEQTGIDIEGLVEGGFDANSGRTE